MIRRNEEYLRTWKEAISILLLLPFSFSLHTLTHYIKLAVSLGPIMLLKYHFCCWLYDKWTKKWGPRQKKVCATSVWVHVNHATSTCFLACGRMSRIL